MFSPIPASPASAGTNETLFMKFIHFARLVMRKVEQHACCIKHKVATLYSMHVAQLYTTRRAKRMKFLLAVAYMWPR